MARDAHWKRKLVQCKCRTVRAADTVFSADGKRMCFDEELMSKVSGEVGKVHHDTLL